MVYETLCEGFYFPFTQVGQRRVELDMQYQIRMARYKERGGEDNPENPSLPPEVQREMWLKRDEELFHKTRQDLGLEPKKFQEMRTKTARKGGHGGHKLISDGGTTKSSGSTAKERESHTGKTKKKKHKAGSHKADAESIGDSSNTGSNENTNNAESSSPSVEKNFAGPRLSVDDIHNELKMERRLSGDGGQGGRRGSGQQSSSDPSSGPSAGRRGSAGKLDVGENGLKPMGDVDGIASSSGGGSSMMSGELRAGELPPPPVAALGEKTGSDAGGSDEKPPSKAPSKAKSKQSAQSSSK